jgi:hypothetical protein
LLAADWLDANLKAVIAVSLNASGAVVVGTAGQSGFAGICVVTKKLYAGDVIDVFRHAEVVEFNKSGPADAAFAAAAAGTVYYAAAGGAAEVAAPAAGTNKGRFGHTVEASRLIVDVQIFQG